MAKKILKIFKNISEAEDTTLDMIDNMLASMGYACEIVNDFEKNRGWSFHIWNTKNPDKSLAYTTNFEYYPFKIDAARAAFLYALEDSE